MTFKLERFEIAGLHGKIDVDIPIKDNKIVLVGVNGLGKTTVVNLLYFLITKQWSRLYDYEFESLAVTVDGHRYQIERNDLERIDESKANIERLVLGSGRPYVSPRTASRLFNHPLFKHVIDKPFTVDSRMVVSLADDLGIPSSVLSRMLRDVKFASQPDMFTYPESIHRMAQAFRDEDEYHVLYLPTYRRIEQDLKAIFPSLDDTQIRDLAANRRWGNPSVQANYVELVQFGMQDVESRINSELKSISDSARSQLSALTASYLRDVIRDDADKYDSKIIDSIEQTTIRNVLRRVEENTLDLDDKRELEFAIERIKQNRSTISERDKYLAHFFLKLLDIYKGLSNSERNVITLVSTCNRYLQGKQLNYNDNDFVLDPIGKDGDRINWKALSSGEKQVVSLFTHVLLAGEKQQLVIIDEPELSLSVVWQKTLLPDVLNTGKCGLLIAVTHSPFIYANELDDYAVDLARCIK
jgi:predicted ATP-dependent endonuclease of OLD family